MCVAMIAAFHGAAPDVGYLRKQSRISFTGATLDQLGSIAGLLKMSARAFRADAQALKYAHCPCILHWDSQHFVVLAKATRRYAVIHDPAIGVRKMLWGELEQRFSGAVMELTPLHEFGDSPAAQRPKMHVWELLGKVRGLKKSLLQMFCLGLCIVGYPLHKKRAQ